MTAYYNEHDPFAAAWLRELIKMGQIAPGIVDERSIEDVRPSDLKGYTQCHFFAGIGVWSYALRRAGWPDDMPVWTGSCPCQPFSAAGKGAGFTDERHLWPAWFHLITTAKPEDVPVFGEQVASKDGLTWLGLVQTDMEAADYAFGAVDLCAAGVGAPHIRQRLFFVAERVADTSGIQHERLLQESNGKPATCCQGVEIRGCGDSFGMADAMPAGRAEGWAGTGGGPIAGGCELGGMADTNSGEQPGIAELRGTECDGANPRWAEGGGSTSACCDNGRMADAERVCDQRETQATDNVGQKADGPSDRYRRHSGAFATEQPGPTNGLWADADWLYCRDGKWRPVEPGTFPLVNGLTKGVVPSSRIGLEIDADKTAEARVMRLKGFGNAINAEVAATFIEAIMTTIDHPAIND